MSKTFKSGINWTKLAIALLFLCSMFGLSAMAQTGQEKPLHAEAVAALIEEMTDKLPDLIEDEDQVTAIIEKWDAREDLAGKTRTQILNLLFTDVRSVVGDKKTQDSVWSIWQEIGINSETEVEEQTAPKPESKPTPNPPTDWKQPKFRFEVEFFDSNFNFKLAVTEVSGLDLEEQPIEYKSGNSKEFSTIKKTGQVILKEGIFVKDNTFWDWLKQIKSNATRKIGVIVKLLDEEGNPTMIWKLYSVHVGEVVADRASITSVVIHHKGLTRENKD